MEATTQTVQSSPVPMSLIMPVSSLLSSTDAGTGQPTYAFPLQTRAWLQMQVIVQTALSFPLSEAEFTERYGEFKAEATVETAVKILGQLQQNAAAYGDPKTLISQLTAFQGADKPPESIYGHAVWLAGQTVIAAQQIRALLELGLNDIGNTTDPRERIRQLTELLTGEGGISTWAGNLRAYVVEFEKKTRAYYEKLHASLSGEKDSLQWYLGDGQSGGQAANVLESAKGDVKSAADELERLAHEIDTLNKEYIGFTVGASLAPVFLIIPFLGIFLSIADATTLGVLASRVKERLDEARHNRDVALEDQAKKAALVLTLEGFNKAVSNVKADGGAFLDAIGQLASGWSEFVSQIDLRLKALTPKEVESWSTFMDTIQFKAAIDGWNLIASRAESFYQAGFVKFTAEKSDN